jgi:integrase
VWLLKRGKTYKLKWPGTGLTAAGRQKYVVESLGRCTKAEAEEARRQKIVDLGGGENPDRPERVTLAELRDLYRKRRARDADAPVVAARRHKEFKKLAPSTLANHDMTMRYLMRWFGEDRVVGEIEAPEAELFVDALEAGKLADARATDQTYGFSEHAIRQQIRNAKTIFSWSISQKMATRNPFEQFDGTSLRGGALHHVTSAELEALVKASPSPGWAAMFALCRLAGLRRSEARLLKWKGVEMDERGEQHEVGVDLSARCLRLVSNKTHHYRVLPIVPRLAEILADAESDSIIHDRPTVTGLGPHNIDRKKDSICQKAGLVPWPKFFKAMRTSRENDWKERGVAEATYAAWMGHSADVSRKHYVSPTATEFQAQTQLA